MLLVELLSSFQISILFQDAADFEDRVPQEAAMKINTSLEQFSLADVCNDMFALVLQLQAL